VESSGAVRPIENYEAYGKVNHTKDMFIIIIRTLVILISITEMTCFSETQVSYVS
jgi:hypothetical protein